MLKTISGFIALWLYSICIFGMPAACSGAIAAEKSETRTIALHRQSLARLGFMTPADARRSYPVVNISGGKGSLPLAGLTVRFQRGLMGLESGNAAKSGLAVPIIPGSFSQPMVTAVGNGRAEAALAFRWTGQKGRYWVRNLTMVSGQFGDTNIAVVDDNCNGTYNDPGADAVLVGREAMAVPLGSTIIVGGRLWKFNVTSDGTSMTLEPAEGPQLGQARISPEEGNRQLIGAVLKTSDGGYFLLKDSATSILPSGPAKFIFAALGMVNSDKLGVIDSNGTSYKIPAGAKPAILKFGRLTVKMSAKYNLKEDQVEIPPPDPETITCKAGKVRFFFPLQTPEIDIYLVGGKKDRPLHRGIKMPYEPRNSKPKVLELRRKRYGLHKKSSYRFEMSWPTVIAQDAHASAKLRL